MLNYAKREHLFVSDGNSNLYGVQKINKLFRMTKNKIISPWYCSNHNTLDNGKRKSIFEGIKRSDTCANIMFTASNARYEN